jgi:hypothetical protein
MKSSNKLKFRLSKAMPSLFVDNNQFGITTKQYRLKDCFKAKEYM